MRTKLRQRAIVCREGVPEEHFRGCLKAGSSIVIETTFHGDGRVTREIVPDEKAATR